MDLPPNSLGPGKATSGWSVVSPNTAVVEVPALSPASRHRCFHRMKHASFASISIVVLLGALTLSVSSPTDQLPSVHHVIMPLERFRVSMFPPIDNKLLGISKKRGEGIEEFKSKERCALQDKGRVPPARRLRRGYISAPCG